MWISRVLNARKMSYAFPCQWLVTSFPAPITGYTFSSPCRWSHVFQRLSLITLSQCLSLITRSQCLSLITRSQRLSLITRFPAPVADNTSPAPVVDNTFPAPVADNTFSSDCRWLHVAQRLSLITRSQRLSLITRSQRLSLVTRFLAPVTGHKFSSASHQSNISGESTGFSYWFVTHIAIGSEV